jgi:primosomal protein N' (replication factor Y)
MNRNKQPEVFADVILPFPLGKPFTYHIPDSIKEKLQERRRVVVPFGKKRLYSGIVVHIHSNQPKGVEVKSIIDVLDNEPVINKIQLQFWKWMADYYMCTVGEVFKAALPSGLKLESETKVILNSKSPGEPPLSDSEALTMEILSDKHVMSIQALADTVKSKNILKTIHGLVEKNLVLLDERLKEAYKPKTEPFVMISPSFDSKEKLNGLLNDLANAPKQLDLMLAYLSASGYFQQGASAINKNELLKKARTSTAPLKSLEDKGILSIIYKEIDRLPSEVNTPVQIHPLSEIQQETLSDIEHSFTRHMVTLFHGVTSSGKTEIYIHLIQKQIAAGNQVLYLLPEIALTTQIINRLKAAFGDKVGIYHSKFNDAERVEVYKKVQKFKTCPEESFPVVLGVRSSVFLPFEKLGLIIIDEEHENTYKQFDPAPRYHARDSAIVLAAMHKANVLLGTATPSIESFYNSTNGKYGYVELTTRFKDIQLPQILLVDLLEHRRKKKMKSMFSPMLLSSIEEALSQKEQVILFQNRRGFSPYLECNTCGWIPHCIHCDVSLVYHKFSNTLVCHYCGYSLKRIATCQACGSQSMETRGFGTEKIEDEVAVFFPQARICRMDLDSTRKKRAYQQIISDFENHKIDILIGTQMLSKGLDFNNVNLVGILNADNMLMFPDFRAHERSFQLMMQVSGRAGRAKKQGKVIIQTSHPNHNIIQCVLDNQYAQMYQSQIYERKEFKYPPFYRMVRISIKHKDKIIVDQAADELAQTLKKTFGFRLMGPEYPLVNRVQSWFIKNIFIKIERAKSFEKAKQMISEMSAELKLNNSYRSLQLHYDVDPM